MVFVMQDEGETDNRKAIIMVSFDDLMTLALQARVELLFFGFFINLLHNSIFTLNQGLI